LIDFVAGVGDLHRDNFVVRKYLIEIQDRFDKDVAHHYNCRDRFGDSFVRLNKEEVELVDFVHMSHQMNLHGFFHYD
jgi:hypothetical protein